MDHNPYFQRLRKLKQLGVTESVYINATHNRKEHSLGVAHLAERLARGLAERQPKLGITDKDVLCVKLAGLCHDLGHGPFSHVYDGPFLDAMRADQARRKEEVDAMASASASASAASGSNDDPYADVPPIPTDWTHEDASLKIIDAILKSNGLKIDKDNLDEPLKQVWHGVDAKRFGISGAGHYGSDGDDDYQGKPYPKERLLTNRDFIFIKECINGGPLNDGPGYESYVGRPAEKEFLYDIVSNRHSGLDVDKIDYFARDQRQCHKGSGEIEVLLIEEAFVCWGECSRPSKCFQCRCEGEEDLQLQRIMRSAAGDKDARRDGMHLMICYPEKTLLKALDFFKTRFRLHSEIYTHRQAKGAEYIICDILKEADPHYRLRAENYPGGLPISRAMLDMTAYANLNDTIIDTIRSSTKTSLRRAQDLIERYEQRMFYKFVLSIEISHDKDDATSLLWEKDEEAIKMELCKMHVSHRGEGREKLFLSPIDIIIEKKEIHHGRKSLNPVDMMRFLPKHELSRLNRSVSELPEARQQSEDKYKSSIPQAFNERAIRIFCRNKKKEVVDLLYHASLQWIEDTKRGFHAPDSWIEMEEVGDAAGDDDDMGAYDRHIANVSQEINDHTPPRRRVTNRNTTQVSADTNQAEEMSPVRPTRGPTNLFHANGETN